MPSGPALATARCSKPNSPSNEPSAPSKAPRANQPVSKERRRVESAAPGLRRPPTCAYPNSSDTRPWNCTKTPRHGARRTIRRKGVRSRASLGPHGVLVAHKGSTCKLTNLSTAATPSEHSIRGFLRTPAAAADAPSLAAVRASRIRGISAVDGASAGRAWIAIEGKAAVATDEPPAVSGVGINVNGTTDEAYGSHFWLLVDACTVAPMHVKQALCDRTVDDSHADL